MKFGLDQETIDRIRDTISSYNSVEDILIYGSRAKGNYRKGSDNDLVVMGNPSFDTLLRIEHQLDELMLPFQTDLSSYNSIQSQDLLDHIHRIGKQFV